MSSCSECGYDWANPPWRAVAAVRALPGRLTGLLHDLGIGNDTAALRARPAAHVWSALEYLGHTGEAIGWYADRVTRILTEERPAFGPFDWDAHTARRRYHDGHLGTVLSGLGDACTRLAAAVSGLNGDGWQRQGIASDGQPRSIEQLVNRAAHEARHHFQDIRAGLTSDVRSA